VSQKQICLVFFGHGVHVKSHYHDDDDWSVVGLSVAQIHSPACLLLILITQLTAQHQQQQLQRHILSPAACC